MLNVLIDLTERGWIPNPLVRMGIRRLCQERLESLKQLKSQQPDYEKQYTQSLKASPLAVATQEANQQHYEVPSDFFSHALGPHLKYSCAYWAPGCENLGQAEVAALEATVVRAEIQDGMKILELGCGWGSLTLTMARMFPHAEITAVSNSSSQKHFILNQAAAKGLNNIKVLTLDLSQTEEIPDQNFDRVISVEMFEHFRNYEILLKRISRWLKPKGKLFVHIFTHYQFPYLFEAEGDDNWMGKYFFTGGQMPSHNLLAQFQEDLKLEKQWLWSGTHYQKTSEAWLENHRKNKMDIMKIFNRVYGADEAARWYHRWEVFFLAVAELFGFKNGQEWGVSHYLFTKQEK